MDMQVLWSGPVGLQTTSTLEEIAVTYFSIGLKTLRNILTLKYGPN